MTTFPIERHALPHLPIAGQEDSPASLGRTMYREQYVVWQYDPDGELASSVTPQQAHEIQNAALDRADALEDAIATTPAVTILDALAQIEVAALLADRIDGDARAVDPLGSQARAIMTICTSVARVLRAAAGPAGETVGRGVNAGRLHLDFPGLDPIPATPNDMRLLGLADAAQDALGAIRAAPRDTPDDEFDRLCDAENDLLGLAEDLAAASPSGQRAKARVVLTALAYDGGETCNHCFTGQIGVSLARDILGEEAA